MAVDHGQAQRTDRPRTKIRIITILPRKAVSEIKLKRTDTTLDLSQKAVGELLAPGGREGAFGGSPTYQRELERKEKKVQKRRGRRDIYTGELVVRASLQTPATALELPHRPQSFSAGSSNWAMASAPASVGRWAYGPVAANSETLPCLQQSRSAKPRRSLSGWRGGRSSKLSSPPQNCAGAKFHTLEHCELHQRPPPWPTLSTSSPAAARPRATRTVLRVVILCFIAAASIASRLFSVIRKWHMAASTQLGGAVCWPDSGGSSLVLLADRRPLSHRLREHHPRMLVCPGSAPSLRGCAAPRRS